MPAYLQVHMRLFVPIAFWGIFLFEMLPSPAVLALQHSSAFPANFLFGTASSSYQYEGAFLSDGKGPSNWDAFSRRRGNILDASNGDVAVDHYHLYPEDIQLMHYLGVNSYRFSISWARILPRGISGGVNLAGIKHYNDLLNHLSQKGIHPFVTLSHYDHPLELEDRYQAWLNPLMQEEFRYFAEVCFEAFGDRVKYWVTFNEPNVQVINGYRIGIYPPSRCSESFGNCTFGDAETEPFIAAHNIILSHAAAADTYRTKYQAKQGGLVGIVVTAIWFEPLSNSSADKLAVERALSFLVNWFLEPFIFGRYPEEMQNILGSNLPKFSKFEQTKLQKSLDFIGINHYTTLYVKDCMFSTCQPGMGSSWTEGFALQTGEKNGVSIGETTEMNYYYVYPQGMENIITYIKERYNNIPIFITENGYGEENNPGTIMENFLQDVKRVKYLESYSEALATAIRKGADVRGYFIWSLLDNFEWVFGYTKRFGLYHVDYATLRRTPKLSATWYKHFIANRTMRNKPYLPSESEI